MIIETTAEELATMISSINSCANAVGATGMAILHNYRQIYPVIQDYIALRNSTIKMYAGGSDSDDPNKAYTVTDPDVVKRIKDTVKPYAEIKYSIAIATVPEICIMDSGLSVIQCKLIDWMIDHSDTESVMSYLKYKQTTLIADSLEAIAKEAEKKEEAKGVHYDVKEPYEF